MNMWLSKIAACVPTYLWAQWSWPSCTCQRPPPSGRWRSRTAWSDRRSLRLPSPDLGKYVISHLGKGVSETHSRACACDKKLHAFMNCQKDKTQWPLMAKISDKYSKENFKWQLRPKMICTAWVCAYIQNIRSRTAWSDRRSLRLPSPDFVKYVIFHYGTDQRRAWYISVRHLVVLAYAKNSFMLWWTVKYWGDSRSLRLPPPVDVPHVVYH